MSQSKVENLFHRIVGCLLAVIVILMALIASFYFGLIKNPSLDAAGYTAYAKSLDSYFPNINILLDDVKEQDYRLSIDGRTSYGITKSKPFELKEDFSGKQITVTLPKGLYHLEVSEQNSGKVEFEKVFRVIDGNGTSEMKLSDEDTEDATDKPSTDSELPPSANYQAVLDDYKKAFDSEWKIRDGFVNADLKNVIIDEYPTSMMRSAHLIKYAEEDLNGDGVNELFIAADFGFGENAYDLMIDSFSYDGGPKHLLPETLWFDMDGLLSVYENNEMCHWSGGQNMSDDMGRNEWCYTLFEFPKSSRSVTSEVVYLSEYINPDSLKLKFTKTVNGQKKDIPWEEFSEIEDRYRLGIDHELDPDIKLWNTSHKTLKYKTFHWKTLSEHKLISEEEAKKIAERYWDDYLGENDGVRMTYFSDGLEEDYEGAPQYRFRLSAFVDDHYTTWDEILVNGYTKEVHNTAE